jgi:hypothetical protein
MLDPLLDALGDALGAIMVPIVDEVLKGHVFSVTKVPAITTEGCQVTLGTVETGYLEVNGKGLLVVQGVPGVSTSRAE